MTAQEQCDQIAAEISAGPEPDPELIRLHDPASARFYSTDGMVFGQAAGLSSPIVKTGEQPAHAR